MYLGKIVETGQTDALFVAPRHPYTQALLDAIPDIDEQTRTDRPKLTGEMPSASNPPPGCAFHTRCPHATALCKTETPALQDIKNDHGVACHHWTTIDAAPRTTATHHQSPATKARLDLYRRATQGAALTPITQATKTK
jgi:peptide/nickel transport system ATP-binding protein